GAVGERIQGAEAWVCGMQSRNGGFGAFDADNTHYSLNEIPFADHGALLDPPTADVSARCIAALAGESGRSTACRDVLETCLGYVHREQESSGAWVVRLGTH